MHCKLFYNTQELFQLYIAGHFLGTQLALPWVPYCWSLLDYALDSKNLSEMTEKYFMWKLELSDTSPILLKDLIQDWMEMEAQYLQLANLHTTQRKIIIKFALNQEFKLTSIMK